MADVSRVRPGSRYVVSYVSDPNRYFERIAGWPVGLQGQRWVAISADGTQVDDDLDITATYHDVTGRSAYPREVHDLEQFDSAL